MNDDDVPYLDVAGGLDGFIAMLDVTPDGPKRRSMPPETVHRLIKETLLVVGSALAFALLQPLLSVMIILLWFGWLFASALGLTTLRLRADEEPLDLGASGVPVETLRIQCDRKQVSVEHRRRLRVLHSSVVPLADFGGVHAITGREGAGMLLVGKGEQVLTLPIPSGRRDAVEWLHDTLADLADDARLGREGEVPDEIRKLGAAAAKTQGRT